MKEKTIEILKEIYEEYSKNIQEIAKKRAIEVAIQSLEQEPFINKECISINVCKHDKEAALEKARKEIEKLPVAFTSAMEMKQDCLKIIEEIKEKGKE